MVNMPPKEGTANAVRRSRMREFKFFLEKMSCLATANLPFIHSFNRYFLLTTST